MSSSFFSRMAAAALMLALSQFASAPSAHAHAVIIGSTPAVDAVVAPDSDVTLQFNSRIDHERSRLTLVAADGATSSVPILPGSAPDIISAKMSGLAAGQYRLRWQVLAIDGHLTRGDIRFSVKAP
jgi:methionine-rich copper-binding protein CopC